MLVQILDVRCDNTETRIAIVHQKIVHCALDRIGQALKGVAALGLLHGGQLKRKSTTESVYALMNWVTLSCTNNSHAHSHSLIVKVSVSLSSSPSLVFTSL